MHFYQTQNNNNHKQEQQQRQQNNNGKKNKKKNATENGLNFSDPTIASKHKSGLLEPFSLPLVHMATPARCGHRGNKTGANGAVTRTQAPLSTRKEAAFCCTNTPPQVPVRTGQRGRREANFPGKIAIFGSPAPSELGCAQITPKTPRGLKTPHPLACSWLRAPPPRVRAP